MHQENPSNEGRVRDINTIFQDFDLCLETDLLGDVFVHDPMYFYESPSFSSVPLLEKYLVNNQADLYKFMGEEENNNEDI